MTTKAELEAENTQLLDTVRRLQDELDNAYADLESDAPREHMIRESDLLRRMLDTTRDEVEFLRETVRSLTPRQHPDDGDIGYD